MIEEEEEEEDDDDDDDDDEGSFFLSMKSRGKCKRMQTILLEPKILARVYVMELGTMFMTHSIHVWYIFLHLP